MTSYTYDNAYTYMQQVTAQAYPGQEIADEIVARAAQTFYESLDWVDWDELLPIAENALRAAIWDANVEAQYIYDINKAEAHHMRMGRAKAVVAYILEQSNARELASAFCYWYTRYKTCRITPVFRGDEPTWQEVVIGEWLNLRVAYARAISQGKELIDNETMDYIYGLITGKEEEL